MTFKRRASGAFVDAASLKRRASGAWVTPGFVRRRSGGAWVDVAVPGAAPGVSITNQAPFSSGVTGTREAGYQLTNTGAVQLRQGISGAAWSTVETWLLSGAAADYDVRATKTAGNATPTGSALATWLNLGTSRSWSVTDGASDAIEQSANVTIEIRNATTLAVIDTASVVFTADRG